MITIDKYEPPFKHVVDMKDIPEHIRDMFYDEACENEYCQFNYSDGDFHYIVDLTAKDELTLDLVDLLPPEFKDGTIAIHFYQ